MSAKADRLWILAAKKKAGEATNAELEELKALIAENTSSGFSYDIIDKIWDAKFSGADAEVSPVLWDKIESKTGENKNRRHFISAGAWTVAASLIICITAALLYWSGGDKRNTPGQHSNLNQVTTQLNSKSRLALPDGTQVWLNGSSKLTYSNGTFGKNDRAVTLTGEAFFDVVKNNSLPFIINTGPVTITVKGTAFNVKAYPGEETIETTLVRGLVEITTLEDPDRKILLKPNEKITIPVNQRAIDSGSERSSDSTEALYAIRKFKAAEDAPAEIAWINTQLVFDNEPLARLAPKMESWYRVKIHFVDETLKSKRFSGVIEQETLRETLEAMQLSYHFKYEIRGSELWLGSN